MFQGPKQNLYLWGISGEKTSAACSELERKRQRPVAKLQPPTTNLQRSSNFEAPIGEWDLVVTCCSGVLLVLGFARTLLNGVRPSRAQKCSYIQGRRLKRARCTISWRAAPGNVWIGAVRQGNSGNLRPVSDLTSGPLSTIRRSRKWQASDASKSRSHRNHPQSPNQRLVLKAEEKICSWSHLRS